jgi:DNA replicative helicase MCM subunit Mcm2 (Cdc46/Mcm family)
MSEIFEYNLGYESITTMHHNKKVEVNGIIKTANPVKPELINAVFQCENCNRIIEVPQGGGKCRLLRPEKCTNMDCQSNMAITGQNKRKRTRKKFKLLQDRSKFLDYQEIWLKPLEVEKTFLKLGRGQKVILKKELAGLKEGQTVNIIGKVSFELIGRTTFARPVVIATKIKNLK